jgi:DNA-binding beta-propeller fold protein YncE
VRAIRRIRQRWPDNKLAVIDPATNTVAERIPVGPGAFVANVADGDVWVGSCAGSDVWRITP